MSQTQSRIKITDETKTAVKHPYPYQYHADVIKREQQNILLLTDHFSTLSTAMLLDNEHAVELK